MYNGLIEHANGTREWYVNGKKHRTDGPAVEYADGTCGWWIHNEKCSFQEWLRLNTELAPQKRTVLVLKYSSV